MKTIWLTCVIGFVVAGVAPAQEKTAQPGKKVADAIAETERLLDAQIETKDFQEEMPFAKFLAALQARLPADKKRSIRLDEAGLGKDFAEIAASPVRLPPVPKKISIGTALRLVIAQADLTNDLNYDARPTGIVVTRVQLTYREVIYDVRDVVEQLPFLVPELQRQYADTPHRIKAMPFLAPWLKPHPGDLLGDVDTQDGVALLLHWLANIDMPPTATVHVQNESRLKVYASRPAQAEISELLSALRRTADRAVVMNARLYEVNRAFFAKHVAPLLPADPDSAERPTVVAIDGALIKLIVKQKLLLESDDVKLRPHHKQTFLATHNVIRYVASRAPGSDGQPNTASVAAGISFAVQALLSRDLRHLRLQIFQDATEVVGIAKAKQRDLFTGKDVEIEIPRVLRSKVTGTVQIPDGDPFLMPVQYRPPGKEDKVWLMVARPLIWIQEEQNDIKSGNISGFKFKWDGPTSKEDEPPPSPPLPLNDDTKEILQALITDVLTNPLLKAERRSWGTPTDRTIYLLDGDKLSWPKSFAPETHGYKLMRGEPDPFSDARWVPGIRLDKFDLKQKTVGNLNAPIELIILRTGVLGGLRLYYEPKRNGKRWTVELHEAFDP